MGTTRPPRPSPLHGPGFRAHAIRTESEICIEGSNIDEPEAANLATDTSSLNKVEVREGANEISTLDNGSGNDISVPPEELHRSSLDNCLNKDVKICEGLGTTSSALPVYWELPSGTLSFNSKGSSLCDRELMLPMQAPSARYMKEEDSQRLKDAKESLRVEKQVVTEVENESDEVQELMHRLIKLKGTG